MKRLISVANFICAMILLAACGNEETTPDQLIDLGAPGHIVINTEEFKTDQDKTRAVTLKTESIDLGNGVVAEVAIQPDKEEIEPTRAAMNNGHYTIYALDGGGTRKATLTGTVSGTTFIRDALCPHMLLDPGTYTFVCINDAVTMNASGLIVSAGTDNPMIGTTTETISGPVWKVSFAMKHQAARVRVKITSYTNQGSGITATLASASAQPATVGYHLDATADATANTSTALTASCAVHESAVTFSPIVQTVERTSDYQYFLPGTQGNDFTLTFTGGTVYGKSLAAKSMALTMLGTLARNDSYTVNIKFKTTPYYLFQDGTVGALGDQTSTRKPIGVVIKEKTATEKGLAVALNEINLGATKAAWAATSGMQDNVNMFPGYDVSTYNNAINIDDGYENTWGLSKDGVTIKGNEQTRYPAFYLAGHYNDKLAADGIVVSGHMLGCKWFLPGFKDWMQLMGVSAISTLAYPTWQANLGFRDWITQAGGTFTPSWHLVMTSMERDAISYAMIYLNYGTALFHVWDAGKVGGLAILPFVHF